MAHKIEARPYGPDSTPEEVEAIRARMRMYEPGIIFWEELPVQTLFSVRTGIAKLDELAKDYPGIIQIVDLRESSSPSQEVRAEITRVYKQHPKIKRIVLLTGKNALANVFARFIGILLGLNCTFHKTFDEALADARKG